MANIKNTRFKILLPLLLNNSVNYSDIKLENTRFIASYLITFVLTFANPRMTPYDERVSLIATSPLTSK